MNKYGLNELRQSYLDFFSEKGHLVLPSFSLVPKNDPSLLLINAGMAPLKSYFTGSKTPPSKRVTTCQKCIRTPDIENVGKTSRHGTFFEMLGNFSFGDYFKTEAINWAWEYLTEVLVIDKNLLYVSVFEQDDEAYDIWRAIEGFDEKRLIRLGKKDNFWEHGTGPCGPCSEIYFDRGVDTGCGDPHCVPGCDCDRYIEVWNLVFTQFDKNKKGGYDLLPSPNIDTGMGLERLAAVCQGADNLFEVDTIKGILLNTCKLTGKTYKESKQDDVSIRVITDHIRGTVHMISDGILPSNEGRGYVLRRLIRRASRHGRLLGQKEIFLPQLSRKVIELSKDAYPELAKKEEYIFKMISIESEKFNQTLDLGMEVLLEMLKNTQGQMLSDEDAFKLHDTFGFPIDLTKEIFEENGKKVDVEGFSRLMQEQKEKAREAFRSKNVAWVKDDGMSAILNCLENEFIGYDTFESEAKLIKTFSGAGDNINAVFSKTPFYAESGGQVGDTGAVTGDGFDALVLDVKKVNGIHVHILDIQEGIPVEGETYTLKVEKEPRRSTMRNHTATHILHKALCDEIGLHVEQKGSYVDEHRLRFDFGHYEAIDKKILEKIEHKVNSVIFSALLVKVEIMDLSQAKKNGAKALFDEKYAKSVRVVSVGDYSSELCGGTHVSNSGEIGPFKIVSETGIASGIRRIEAVTGFNTLEIYKKRESKMLNISSFLKTGIDELDTRVISLIEKNRELTKELEGIKQQIAASELDSSDNRPIEIGGINVFSRLFSDTDMKTLREMVDMTKDKNKDSVIIYGAVMDGRINFIVYSSDKAISLGINADDIVKEVAAIAGGGGGGRPSLAQAGGKDPDKAKKALDKGLEIVSDILS